MEINETCNEFFIYLWGGLTINNLVGLEKKGVSNVANCPLHQFFGFKTLFYWRKMVKETLAKINNLFIQNQQSKL